MGIQVCIVTMQTILGTHVVKSCTHLWLNSYRWWGSQQWDRPEQWVLAEMMVQSPTLPDNDSTTYLSLLHSHPTVSGSDMHTGKICDRLWENDPCCKRSTFVIAAVYGKLHHFIDFRFFLDYSTPVYCLQSAQVWDSNSVPFHCYGSWYQASTATHTIITHWNLDRK